MFLDNFLLVARQVAVLFALVAVGFACNRCRGLDAGAVRGLVTLLVTVVTPALLVQVFQRPYDSAALPALGVMALAAVVAHLLGIALSRAVRLRGNAARQDVLRFAVIFSNAGFMGIPLQQAVLGADGVFYGGVFVGVFNLFCWTYGLRLMAGTRDVISPRRLLVNPGLVGIVLALVLFLARVRLPEPVMRPVEMLADLNTPLAMIVIGYYLAQARLEVAFASVKAWAALALRLFAVPFATLALLALAAKGGFAMDAKLPAAAVIASAAPVAALTGVFAVQFGRDTSMAVGIVALSTVLSVVTLPLVVGLALTVFR